jgi:hypothetical protein
MVNISAASLAADCTWDKISAALKLSGTASNLPMLKKKSIII